MLLRHTFNDMDAFCDLFTSILYIADILPFCRLRWTVAEADLEAAEPRIQQLRSEGSRAKP